MSFGKTILAGVAAIALTAVPAMAQDDHHDDAHPADHAAPAHQDARPAARAPVQNHVVQNHVTENHVTDNHITDNHVTENHVVENHGAVHDVPHPAGGGSHHWAQGGHYTGNRVVISDWGHHPHLYSPPIGYEWVQDDDGEFVLIALSTGIIANIVID